MTPAKALDLIGQRLFSMYEVPEIVWPNTTRVPVALPYLTFQVASRGSLDLALAGGAEQLSGRVVVIVVAELNTYGKVADKLAQEIKERFPRGPLPAQTDGVLTIVQSQVLSGYPTDTDWRVPVEIDWRA